MIAIPAAGGASDPPAPNAEPFDGGWAVPVSTQAPAWFTADYAQQVLAAGDDGARLPTGVTMPTAAGAATPGIHPGQWLITIINNSKEVGFAWCSANFVFVKSG